MTPHEQSVRVPMIIYDPSEYANNTRGTKEKRFVEAMGMIRREILTDKQLLKNAPHTSRMISSNVWEYEYEREQAAYPMNQKNKFWPAVARIDNVYGDRNLVCSCSDYFQNASQE